MLEESNLACCTLSETWLNNQLPDNLLYVPGYNLFRWDRSYKRANKQSITTGGGLAIYIKADYVTTDTEVKKQNLSNCNIETQWLFIKKEYVKKTLVINLYRPPNGNTKDFLDAFQSQLQRLQDYPNTDVFILGDFNIDLKNTTDPNGKRLLNICKVYGLEQFIKNVTRHGNTKNSTIDLIFTNSKYIANSGVLNLNLSDHEMVFISKKRRKDPKIQTSFRGRSYRYYNKNDFQQSLVNLDWSDYFSSTSSDKAWELLEKKIKLVLDRSCPIRNFRINKVKENWLPNEVLEQIKDKDYFLSKAKITNDPDDWRIARMLRNRVINLTRYAKADYIKSNLEIHKDDPKKYWKIIKDILPDGQKNKKLIALKDDTDSSIDHDKTAAFINKFFVSIGPKLAESFDKEWIYHGPTFNQVFEFKQIDDVTTEKQIKNINTKKSSAINDLSSQILKDAFSVLVPKLTFLFNLSISNNDVPQAWKLAKVIPLPKDGDPEDVNNLRPISLLPLPGKLLEKVIHTQLMEYLTANSIIDKNQGGFRKGFSTMSTIAKVTDNIYAAMNNSKLTLAVFIDFKKAFDTLNHAILLKKLTKLGLTNNAVKWIQNYLSKGHNVQLPIT